MSISPPPFTSIESLPKVAMDKSLWDLLSEEPSQVLNSSIYYIELLLKFKKVSWLFSF
jgi:hypothetical protein